MFIYLLFLTLCILSTCVFVYFRTKNGGLSGLFSKIVASFLFITLAVASFMTKTALTPFVSCALGLLVLGLVCGLIGDILLDLKVIYPFHENAYLYAGMTSFSIGHLLFISSILTFAASTINLSKTLIWICVLATISIILTTIIYFVSTRVMKLKFNKFAPFVNFYAFLLIFTLLLSIYLAIIGVSVIILAVGFFFFLVSDLILSLQYFGGKQSDKTLIALNHILYYVAQILIASFVFFA